MNMTSILVTGGAGYIGSHTCKALAADGFLPVVLDNLTTGHREFVKWGPLVQTDISDFDSVVETIERFDVRGVIHFAAKALVGESVLSPAQYYNNNLIGTFHLLEAMRHASCQFLIFSSTCAIYGVPDTAAIGENTIKNPINPYGASKLFVEQMLKDYASAYGLRSIALRYFNACGADKEGDIGELREIETHLIPRALISLLSENANFVIHGTDYPTPDGTAIRDYIHVSDLADAHVAALRHLFHGGEGGAYNLGTGRGYSVKQVLDAITSITGLSIRVTHGDRRDGDPPMLVADPTQARQHLHFRPSQSDLQEIISTAWKWHQKTALADHVSRAGMQKHALG
jgi:UDP-glucose 4-epimerase/UDP-arabinose 4-epimerase